MSKRDTGQITVQVCSRANCTKTITYCSFVNNKVKIILYQGKNPSCNITDFLNKKFKKGMDEGIRMILIVVKKETDQTFRA